MFFPERIISIKATDKVLEVGPGGAAHPRSNILLEKTFNDNDALKQRGNTNSLKTDKEVVYYSGGKFPFDDDAFDYVICSHVLEHIPEDEFISFVNELQRISKKGYIEYPTIYYEYLYNFKVHMTFLNYKNNSIYYMSKEKSSLNSFFPIQVFFYRTLENGYDEVIRDNKEYFFQGFEWFETISVIKTTDINEMIIDTIDIKKKEKPVIKEKIKTRIKIFIRKLLK